ncbi:hypothetical protein DFH11DRAFT_1631296 [Phellopilus nigrolimitatus]|nr:hypothetical protein DFH11DRAFT_1631296 [Phellopilus nigrolimitatus]
MATETQAAPSTSSTTATPQVTVLTRVASIPLISDSLAAVHATLAGNAYTKTPYSTAQAWGYAAFRASEPIQSRLSPVILRADGFANKAVDAVESRYPYPFHAPTEEIYGTLKQHSEHAYSFANKTIDDRVRTPAYGLAQGIDQKFTPVIDRLAYVRTDSDAPGPDVPVADTPKDTYQYQRAYRLSLDLKDTITVFTGEQIKQIQEHNILVQRATATAQTISVTLSTSYDAATARVHALSDTMLSELHSLQASAAALPAHAQTSLSGLSERVGTVIGQVKDTLRADAPVAEKLGQLRVTIEQQVKPLLAGASARAQGVANAVRSPKTNGAPVHQNGGPH